MLITKNYIILLFIFIFSCLCYWVGNFLSLFHLLGILSSLLGFIFCCLVFFHLPHSTHARTNSPPKLSPNFTLYIKLQPLQINHDVQAGNLILDLDDCVSAYAMAAIIESKRLAMTASDAIDELSIFRAKRKIMPTPLKMLGKVTQARVLCVLWSRDAYSYCPPPCIRYICFLGSGAIRR
jgi:hypothetical protein